MNTKTKKIVIVAVAVLAVLLVAFLALRFVVKPAGVFGIKEVTVVITDLEKSETFTFKTEREFLGDALVDEGLVVDNQTEYGLFITSANGVLANDANQEWWCLTKGGEVHMLGASETPLAHGDHYELTLTVGYDW